MTQSASAEFFIVDTFCDRELRGNPAGVVIRSAGISVPWMELVADELAQPATAFVEFGSDEVALRWFTPLTELVLCGHGTLAAGCVALLGNDRDAVSFTTVAGSVRVVRKHDLFELDFPPRHYVPTEDRSLADTLGVEAVACGKAGDEHLVEVATVEQVVACRPDLEHVRRLARSVVITAAGGNDADVTSRVFAPAIGIAEDQVTGSAHSGLATWWSSRIGTDFIARQASPRGGRIWVGLDGDRVRLAGRAIVSARGTLEL